MKPSLVVFIVPLILGIALYYVNKLDTDSEAEKNIVIKKAVIAMGRYKNNRPKNVKKIFVSGRQRLFCFIDYTNAYSGQKISFHWIRNNTKIGESIGSLKPEYDSTYATLDHNFTPGQYQVRVFVNKVEKKRATFKVVDKLKKYSLTVHKAPSDATVRVLNIGPVYHDGIKLESGRYHIEVTAPGYKAYKEWASISDANVNLNISLEREATDFRFVPDIDVSFAKKMIKQFYDSRGEWAGVFVIDYIDKVRIEKVSEKRVNVHALYKYKPAPIQKRPDRRTGFDRRVFNIIYKGTKWRVVKMGRNNSARF